MRGIDIAYGRALEAPYSEILRAVARWNRQRAKNSHGADAVRYRLNVLNCDTLRAEALAGVKEAA